MQSPAACPSHHILRELHDSPTGGHLGQGKLISKLKQQFYWPGSLADAKWWCTICSVCATHAPHWRALPNTVRAGSLMLIVAVDILGLFPDSPSGNGGNGLLHSLGRSICHPESRGINRCTKTGASFDSGILIKTGSLNQLFCKRSVTCLASTKHTTPKVMAWWNFNRTLLFMLATSAKNYPSTCDSYLPQLCMAYTTVQASTGYTPHVCTGSTTIPGHNM